MTRTFEDIVPFNKCKDYDLLNRAGTAPGQNILGQGPRREGFTANYTGDYRAMNFQHNRLMQFFSPEVSFRDNAIDASYKLNIVGLAESSDIACWSTETNPINALTNQETIFRNGINTSSSGVNPQQISGTPGFLHDFGFFGPANRDTNMCTHQVYRSFEGTFHPSTGSTQHDTYGSPELTQEGADFKNYNGNAQLFYSNNLKTMKVDNFTEDGPSDDADVRIKGCNTIGAKC